MRIVFFILIFIGAITLPWYVAATAALLYAFRYFAPEILGAAFVLDIYFGVTVAPLYTISAAVCLTFIEWYKAYSSFYNRQ